MTYCKWSTSQSWRSHCVVGYEALARFTGSPLPPDAWFQAAAKVLVGVPAPALQRHPGVFAGAFLRAQ